jgi:uncharacterized membrane protein (UPF0127 family)
MYFSLHVYRLGLSGRCSAHGAAVNIIKASTWLSRAGGLLVRPTLKKGEVLWLTPCNAIHTFGMRYPIAVFFLDQQGQVIKVRPSVIPNRIAYCLSAHSVCEMLPINVDQTGVVSSLLSAGILSKTAT